MLVRQLHRTAAVDRVLPDIEVSEPLLLREYASRIDLQSALDPADRGCSRSKREALRCGRLDGLAQGRACAIAIARLQLTAP